MSHKLSTTLRNLGTGADFVGFATLQGVDPASPANRLEARTSTQPSFARYEICETCGLKLCPIDLTSETGPLKMRLWRAKTRPET